MTNMVIEAGGKSGFIEADEVTEAYLKGRAKRPLYHLQKRSGCEVLRELRLGSHGHGAAGGQPNLPDKVAGVSKVSGAKVHSAFLVPAPMAALKTCGSPRRSSKAAKWPRDSALW